MIRTSSVRGVARGSRPKERRDTAHDTPVRSSWAESADHVRCERSGTQRIHRTRRAGDSPAVIERHAPHEAHRTRRRRGRPVHPALAGDGAKTCSGAALAGEGRRADIVDTAVAAGSFKTLATAAPGRRPRRDAEGPGPFTVFAPTDEAFAKLPAGTVETCSSPRTRRSSPRSSPTTSSPARSWPPTSSSCKAAKTVEGGDASRSKVANGGVMVDGAKVVKTDIAASQRRHPRHRHRPPATAAKQNIVETAVAPASSRRWCRRDEGRPREDALRGQLTVFAPTDAAFAKLPAGTVEGLLLPENKAKLKAILKLHVIPGHVYADQVGKVTGLRRSTAASCRSSKPRRRHHRRREGRQGRHRRQNGVIHVIDTVVLPG